MRSHAGNGAWPYFVGPAVFLFFLACLALVTLVALGVRRHEPLVALAWRARRRLEQGRALPMLWGLSAAVLVFAASALLFQTHVLALLGVMLLVAGVLLASVGVAVAAGTVGDELSRALDDSEVTALASLRLGLGVLFLATWLPGVGWLVTILVGATGLGAVLEVLFTRTRME